MSVVLRLAKATRYFRRYRWSWLTAAMLFNALVLVAAPVTAWLYYMSQHDRAAHQVQQDLAWLEANMSQTLALNSERLQDWSNDLAPHNLPARQPATEAFLQRIELMLKENPALLAIDHLDAHGQRRAGLPAYVARPAHLPAVNDPLIVDAIRRAGNEGRPVYSQVIEQYAPLWVLVVPVLHQGQARGVLLGIYDLNQLMSQIVPRQMVQRYDLNWLEREPSRLTHQPGSSGWDNHVATQPGTHSGFDSDPAALKTIAFGPANSGLLLRVRPHGGGQPGVLLLLLTLVVVVLAGLIIFLLRLLQRWLRERLKVQYALAKELRFREAMEQSLSTGLLAFDRSAKIIYANAAICQLLGLAHESLIGSTAPYAFWPQPDSAEYPQALQVHQAMLRGENPAQGHDVTFITANGSQLAVRLFASALVDGDNYPRGWMASLYDRTAEQLATNLAHERDELLQYSSRLASLAEFASGIAHELNQPLAAIANYAGAADCLLDLEPLPGDKIRQAVQRMGDESRRAGQIVHSLRGFIQKRVVRLETHNLCALVSEPLTLLAPLLQRLQIKVQVCTVETHIMIECDAVMIEQVIFNLLRNAVEAQTEAGKHTDPIVLQMQREQGHVLVNVRDHGTGIADPKKLFQAFYSTKREGMGLGLAICRTVIESHGGRLWAENSAGGGAMFSFRLPCLA